MKRPTEWTDEMLKSAILGGTARREAAFTYLYRQSGWYEWVIRHVKSTEGDRQDGYDVFQESVVLFDRKIRYGLFREESALQTFFYGIARQVWKNIKRGRPHLSEQIPEQPDPAGDMEQMLLKEERKRIVNLIINQLSKKCRKVLPLYMLSFTNKEIADELGLSSAEMAKKDIYRCRVRFRKFVMQHEGLQKLLNINPEDEK